MTPDTISDYYLDIFLELGILDTSGSSSDIEENGYKIEFSLQPCNTTDPRQKFKINRYSYRSPSSAQGDQKTGFYG